jgi:hypothetical protein
MGYGEDTVKVKRGKVVTLHAMTANRRSGSILPLILVPLYLQVLKEYEAC